MVPVLTSAIFLQEKSKALAVPCEEVVSSSGQVRGELGEDFSVLMGEEGRLEMVGRGDLGEVEEELSSVQGALTGQPYPGHNKVCVM
jgi:hypothetical protein